MALFDTENLIEKQDKWRTGLHVFNKRVVAKRKRKRSPEECEPGAECPSCGTTEAGVRGFEGRTEYYRLYWVCQNCSCSWEERKPPLSGPNPDTDKRDGSECLTAVSVERS